MKTIPKSITVGLLALGLSSFAFADYIELADRTFSLMLTAKYSAPGLKVKDPDTGETDESFEDSQQIYDKNDNLTKEVFKYSSVTKTFKYGNKEIVQDALENQLLPDGTMSGWALVVTDDGEQPMIQLKKGDTYVDVGIYLGEDTSIGDIAAKYDDTKNYTYAYDPDFESYVEIGIVNTVSGSYTEEGKISLVLEDVAVTGAYASGGKILSFYPRYEDENGKMVEDKSEAYYEYIPAAGRITGLVGTGELEDGSFAVITGSASVGVGKGTILRE
jgi:hypothetical protein